MSRDYWFCKIVLEGSKDYLCSGVYLGDRYILTAASKLLASDSPYDLMPVQPEEGEAHQPFLVVMGLDSSDTSVFSYNVSKVTIHPDFHKDLIEYRNSDDEYVSTAFTYTNDLAIIKLERTPSQDSFSGISLLPTDMVSDVMQPGTVLNTIGMGQREYVWNEFENYLISNYQSTDLGGVQDVPLTIDTSDQIYLMKPFEIEEYPMTFRSATSDNSWSSLFKTHSAQYMGQSKTFLPTGWNFSSFPTYTPIAELSVDEGLIIEQFTHTDIAIYLLDTSKNTNSDSISTIQTQTATLTSDWINYWKTELLTDSTLLQVSSDAITKLTDNSFGIEYFVNGTVMQISSDADTVISSDFFLTNKIFAANYGSDEITTSDIGLLSFNIGSPLTYISSDNTNYLLGIYNYGADTSIDETVRINQVGLPSIFTNLMQYRTWILENSLEMYEFNDAEIIINYRDLTVTNEEVSIKLSDYYDNNFYFTNSSDIGSMNLWKTMVYTLSTDLNNYLNSDFATVTTDIAQYRTMLTLYSSEGSSDYALTSDISADFVTYQSDINSALFGEDYYPLPAFFKNIYGSDSNGGIYDIVSDIEDDLGVAADWWKENIYNIVMKNTTMPIGIPRRTANFIDNYQESLDRLYNSTGTLNKTIIDLNNSNVPTSYRDSNYRLRVSNPTIIFDAQSFYDPYNDHGRDEQFDTKVTGEGDITHNNDKAYYALAVTEEDDYAIRQTSRYVPDLIGQSKVVYLAGVLATNSTGISSVVSKIGIFTPDNGYYFRLDGDGISVCELSHQVELKIAQSRWNLDPMDGTGSSGIDFSAYPIANGQIPQLVDLKYQHLIMVVDTQYTGLVRMGFCLNGVIRYVHQFAHEHYKYTPIHSSRVPLRYEISKVDGNNNNVVNELRMTWCSITVDGPYQPHFNTFSHTNARVEKVEVTPADSEIEGFMFPVFSLRLRSQYTEGAFKIKRLQLNLTTENDIYWELIKNATLIGAKWGVEGTTGSMVEIDNDATKFVKGYPMKEGILTSSQLGEYVFIKDISEYVSEKSISVNIDGEQDTLSFAVKTLSGKNPPKLWYIIEWVEMY